MIRIMPVPNFSNINLKQFAINLLENDLTPLLHIVTDISFFIGLCLILIGLSRLHRHGQGQQVMFRVSPIATGMYFLSGVVLISFMPHLQMISNSLFSANSVLTQQCIGPIPGPGQGFTTNSNNFCPMYAYAMDINSATGDTVKATIKYLVFAVLVFVGIISFIRGMIQLVRIGEGQGQGTVDKALSHIFAGIVAVNIDSVYALMQNVLSATGNPI
jgi:hypothetical protein